LLVISSKKNWLTSLVTSLGISKSTWEQGENHHIKYSLKWDGEQSPCPLPKKKKNKWHSLFEPFHWLHDNSFHPFVIRFWQHFKILIGRILLKSEKKKKKKKKKKI